MNSQPAQRAGGWRLLIGRDSCIGIDLVFSSILQARRGRTDAAFPARRLRSPAGKYSSSASKGARMEGVEGGTWQMYGNEGKEGAAAHDLPTNKWTDFMILSQPGSGPDRSIDLTSPVSLALPASAPSRCELAVVSAAAQRAQRGAVPVPRRSRSHSAGLQNLAPVWRVHALAVQARHG